jgi:hypothetical protein
MENIIYHKSAGTFLLNKELTHLYLTHKEYKDGKTARVNAK